MLGNLDPPGANFFAMYVHRHIQGGWSSTDKRGKSGAGSGEEPQQKFFEL